MILGDKPLILRWFCHNVHIVDMSVSKLLMAEQLILVHLLNGADGDVVAVRGHMNIIVCKIMSQPWGPVWQWHEG
jgi:hypothetical protein